MDQLKIENFSKSHTNVSFPEYVSLGPGAASKIRALFSGKLGLNDSADRLQLVMKVDACGTLLNERADGRDFRISDVFSRAGLGHPMEVYVNWYRFDAIDKLSFSDLDRFFDDIWYPGSDDIDVFDESMTWILSISHSGQIKVLHF